MPEPKVLLYETITYFTFKIIFDRLIKKTRVFVQAFKERTLAQFKSDQSLAAVFKGSKYNDTCISEIKFDHAKRQYQAIEKIYLNAAENTIYMDTQTVFRIILDRDLDAVFQILDTSVKRQWVIVIRMPAEAGDSRVETAYVLYNTRLKRRVPAKVLGFEVGEMYDFEQAGNEVQDYWTITVVKARGLKNKDWVKHRIKQLKQVLSGKSQGS